MIDSNPRARLRAIYDPHAFAADGRALVDRVASFMEEASRRPSLDWVKPDALIARMGEGLRKASGDFGAVVDAMLENAHRLHSPTYMGHQVPPPLPAAGLFDALVSITNQGGALYEMSPSITAAERALIPELTRRIGWDPKSADGIGTSGGTLANLTAILTARNLRYGTAWEEGMMPSGRTPVILTSDGAHYSVARAAGVLGFGTRNVIRVAGDEAGKLRPQAVLGALARAEHEGKDVFAIVASACSTSMGTFDELPGIGELAASRGIWFHVDGAHGASVLFSKRYRSLASGIERADSVTWDAHKMLFVPSLSTFLLYRNGSHALSAFSQDAPYLFDPDAPGMGALEAGRRTFECTRHTLAASLWGVWALYGPQVFEDLVDVTFDLVREFHGMLSATSDFVPLHVPESNILCFQHLPPHLEGASPEAVSTHQQGLRKRLVEEGRHYITSTRVGGQMALRVVLMNPLIERHHLEGLLEEIRSLGNAGLHAPTGPAILGAADLL